MSLSKLIKNHLSEKCDEANLATMIGVPRGALKRVLAGSFPNLRTSPKFQKFLGLSDTEWTNLRTGKIAPKKAKARAGKGPKKTSASKATKKIRTGKAAKKSPVTKKIKDGRRGPKPVAETQSVNLAESLAQIGKQLAALSKAAKQAKAEKNSELAKDDLAIYVHHLNAAKRKLLKTVLAHL